MEGGETINLRRAALEVNASIPLKEGESELTCEAAPHCTFLVCSCGCSLRCKLVLRSQNNRLQFNRAALTTCTYSYNINIIYETNSQNTCFYFTSICNLMDWRANKNLDRVEHDTRSLNCRCYRQVWRTDTISFSGKSVKTRFSQRAVKQRFVSFFPHCPSFCMRSERASFK